MRVEGWERIASAYIERMAVSAFEWGANDCVLFSCNLAKEMTGKDPAESIRGKYKSKKTAYALISKAKRPPEIVIDDYFKKVPIGFAQRGDIVFRRNDDGGFNFGLVWDGKAVFLAEGQGIVFEKLEGLTAWRVD